MLSVGRIRSQPEGVLSKSGHKGGFDMVASCATSLNMSSNRVDYEGGQHLHGIVMQREKAASTGVNLAFPTAFLKNAIKP